MSDIS